MVSLNDCEGLGTVILGTDCSEKLFGVSRARLFGLCLYFLTGQLKSGQETGEKERG